MRTINITGKPEIDTIIRQCTICFLGLVGNDGTPHVIPMNFGYEGNEIILHSKPDAKQVALATANNRVCVTFCTESKLVFQHPDVACSYRMQAKSVVCKGNVSFIEALDEKEKALDILMRNYSGKEFKYSLPALANVKVWKVAVTEMTAKAFGQKP
ncbi:MAG TPA: pyridoxamine 5'-phosphate oxidase family protein [Paludibacter sp.]|nr:pyridoxamine 5'-phosphate oxidase family protein [Paludibacter sp.]